MSFDLNAVLEEISKIKKGADDLAKIDMTLFAITLILTRAISLLAGGSREVLLDSIKSSMTQMLGDEEKGKINMDLMNCYLNLVESMKKMP